MSALDEAELNRAGVFGIGVGGVEIEMHTREHLTIRGTGGQDAFFGARLGLADVIVVGVVAIPGHDDPADAWHSRRSCRGFRDVRPAAQRGCNYEGN
jgi:hypothetical protein